MNLIHSAFIPIHPFPSGHAEAHPLGSMPLSSETTGVTDAHFLLAPSLSTPCLFHMQNYIWLECVQMLFLLERETSFQVLSGKQVRLQ